MTYQVDAIDPKGLEERVPSHLSGGDGSERSIKRRLHFAKPVNSIQKKIKKLLGCTCLVRRGKSTDDLGCEQPRFYASRTCFAISINSNTPELACS